MFEALAGDAPILRNEVAFFAYFRPNSFLSFHFCGFAAVVPIFNNIEILVFEVNSRQGDR